MLPVWAIRRSLTIRSIRVVAAETDVLFLPVIGVMTDRLAAGLLIRQWRERMGEQRHLPIAQLAQAPLVKLGWTWTL